MPGAKASKKPVSKAQNRLMQAAKHGDVPGIPASVGQEFARGAHGKSLKKLPEHKKPKKHGK